MQNSAKKNIIHHADQPLNVLQELADGLYARLLIAVY